ncbi:hypothetical protein SEA_BRUTONGASTER_42 [Gordonia phage BrutonGaster]|uniref:Uncharacterized protein n=1 Tax=Gordonia phage BrutonGaster TaxID=2530116 RepID=A0A482JLJ4_9CAUD|nr:hypothetical protein HOV26_gp140 [Gordonia phage BrutonGaster]QBP33259.1 hypothetical protein SEA_BRUTONGASTER_42 [Gordonia phage BrutonGaster]
MRSPFRRDHRELAAAKQQADKYEEAEKRAELELARAEAVHVETRKTNERIRRAHLEKNGFTEMLQAAWGTA